MSSNPYLDALADVILKLHGCRASYVETVPVKETFQGKTVWEGEVEVFSVNHAKASRCYAWAFDKDGKPEYVAVLGLPPVDSPLEAVQAFIVSGERRSP